MLLGFESVASPVVGEMAKKPSSMDDSEMKSIAKANAAYGTKSLSQNGYGCHTFPLSAIQAITGNWFDFKFDPSFKDAISQSPLPTPPYPTPTCSHLQPFHHHTTITTCPPLPLSPLSSSSPCERGEGKCGKRHSPERPRPTPLS